MSRSLVCAVGLLVAIPATAGEVLPDPPWMAEAVALIPAGYVAGRLTEVSADGRTARVAAYPANANDPRTPASAFDPGYILAVTLEAGRVVEGDFRPRAPDLPEDDPENGSEADYDRLHREIRNQANVISGTEPCELGAWSIDDDPAGLNVRVRPDRTARILGRLPAPFTFGEASEAAPEGGFRTEFTIVGYQDGWFLIDHATPPGSDYVDADDYPEDFPDTFGGRGWVAAAMVGAAFANGGTEMGGLYQAPHIDAKWMPAKDEWGNPIGPDNGLKRVLACSGLWALVETDDGTVGWWRRLCSNQVTNCS